MPRLAELYVATRTRNVEDAGTSDAPSLLLSRAGQDLFEVPLEGDIDGLGTGRAAVFRIDVSDQALDSEGLELRLLAGGNDAWAPEHVIVWGIAGRLPREIVVPLAAQLELASPVTAESAGTWLSTDSSEGVSVLLLRPVGQGTRTTHAWRMIAVFVTDPYPRFLPGGPGPGGSLEETGTDGPVTLQAGGPGRLVLSYQVPSTPQGDLWHGRANFYLADLAAPFSRAYVEGGSFTLTIGSSDWWVPSYVAVFGLDTTFGQPNMLIPFVHAPTISLERMSCDPSEGWHTNALPHALVVQPGLVFPPVTGGVTDGVLDPMARKAGDSGSGRPRRKVLRIDRELPIKNRRRGAKKKNKKK
jgi:hypothetical protein